MASNILDGIGLNNIEVIIVRPVVIVVTCKSLPEPSHYQNLIPHILLLGNLVALPSMRDDQHCKEHLHNRDAESSARVSFHAGAPCRRYKLRKFRGGLQRNIQHLTKGGL